MSKYTEGDAEWDKLPSIIKGTGDRASFVMGYDLALAHEGFPEMLEMLKEARQLLNDANWRGDFQEEIDALITKIESE